MRKVTSAQLEPIYKQARIVVGLKPPLALSNYAAVEILTGPPLGACAVRDARHEMMARRLKWLVYVANQPGLVGTVHRRLATFSGPLWVEPTPALAAALEKMHWKVTRNFLSPLAGRWPHLDPEPHYGGTVLLEPQDAPCPENTVWTDGSIRTQGGAAALQLSTSYSCLCSLGSPRSSTHCELVALSLVAQFHPAPRLVLTDSLCALQLISSWERRPVRSVLSCTERVEVRTFISQWENHPHPPTLEKVKAHDEDGVAAGRRKAVGNDRVDALAKEAAVGVGSSYTPDARFGDAVQLQDASGNWILEVGKAVAKALWESNRQEAAARRPWIAQLYPAGMEFDWTASGRLFHPPKVVSGHFIHAAPPQVLKWVARARTGALATNARKAHTGLGSDPSKCPCCDAPLEDDAHVIAGCPQTGSADCEAAAAQLWLKVTAARGVQAVPLTVDWLHTHLLQLAVGLIPMSMHALLAGTDDWVVPVVLKDFQLGMAERLAEALRRREQLVSLLHQAAGRAPVLGSMAIPSAAVQARQLSVSELRAAEHLSLPLAHFFWRPQSSRANRPSPCCCCGKQTTSRSIPPRRRR